MSGMSSFVSSCWPIFNHIGKERKKKSKPVLKEFEGQVMVARFLHGQDEMKTSLKMKRNFRLETKFQTKTLKI
jgi:hypothetical protein